MMLTVLVIAVFLVVARWRRRRWSGRGRARAVVLVIAVLGFSLSFGTPAMAQDDCVQAPVPEKPSDGLVGLLDSSGVKGEEDSPYRLYAYAGMVWHFHGDTCGGISRWANPGASFDTWAGNGLFDLAKNIVGATNSLHYRLLIGDWPPIEKLRTGLQELTGQIFDNIYLQLLSLCLLIVAVLLFRRVWRGDLSEVGKRAVFLLGVLGFASSSLVILDLTPAFARTLITVTNSVRLGFVEPEAVGRERDVLPTDLHDRVIHDSWLRGEFGSPDAEQADVYGDDLLAAKAWTRDEAKAEMYRDERAVNAKKAKYRKIANELGTTTGYFRGTAGNRVGVGFLALAKGLGFGLFPLCANLSIFLLTAALVFIALLAPVIGLVCMFRPDLLRRIVMGFFTQVYYVLVMSMLSGVYHRFLQLIFLPEVQLPLLTQILLSGMVTAVFIVVFRFARRAIRRTKRDAKNQVDSEPSETGDTETPAPEDFAPSLEVRPEAEIPTTGTAHQPDGGNQPDAAPQAETDVVDGLDDNLLFQPSIGVVDRHGRPVPPRGQDPPEPRRRRRPWRR